MVSNWSVSTPGLRAEVDALYAPRVKPKRGKAPPEPDRAPAIAAYDELTLDYGQLGF